jgi:hypothetical protein
VPPEGYPWGLAAPGRTVLGAYYSAREVGEDGGVAWGRGFHGYLFSGALLTDGTLLAAQTGDGGSSLYAVDRSGAERFTCPLPGVASAGVPHSGLWIAHLGRGSQEAIVAFEAKGVELAPQGWVTLNGSPSNDRRPR